VSHWAGWTPTLPVLASQFPTGSGGSWGEGGVDSPCQPMKATVAACLPEDLPAPPQKSELTPAEPTMDLEVRRAMGVGV
jgi:hypothetical protein